MSSLWRLRDCLPPLPRPSFLRDQDLKPRQPISLLFSSEGLMVDRLRLFTSSNIRILCSRSYVHKKLLSRG
uniref:Uncharacterized protein n=1 Tax=Brassica oleracea TaxID=3712 RepID=A0A3P6DIY6_BRAOL|nr:unnamed protein product [Brassica oleracea]